MVEVQLQSAGSQLVAAASRLEVDSLGGPSAVDHLRYVSSLESSLSALKASLALRVEETNAHVLTAHSSATSLVAEVGGLSFGDAVALLRTARTFQTSPDTEAALASGSISVSAAREVARGLAADPAAEQKLLDTARSDSVQSVKKEATRTVVTSGSETSQAARAERLRQNRYLSFWDVGDGSTSGRFNMPNEMWARLWSVLEPEAKRQFRTARDEGRHQSQGAYMVDGLVGLVTGSSVASQSAKTRKSTLNVVIDESALRRGYAQGGETCEVPGVGPVSVQVARDLYDGHCLLNLLVRKGQDITTVASVSRHVPAAIQKAIGIKERQCAVRGCHKTLGLALDHWSEMRDGGLTKLDNLAWLCPEHHHLKTQGFITLSGSAGDYIATFTGKEGPRNKRKAKQKAKGPPPSLF